MSATATLSLSRLIQDVLDQGAIRIPLDDMPGLRRATMRLKLAREGILVDIREKFVVLHQEGIHMSDAGVITRRFRVTMIVESDSEESIRRGQWETDTIESIVPMPPEKEGQISSGSVHW
jgi:hypothetical protein